MQIKTEKCFLKVGNETKRAFLVDLFDDDPVSLYDNEKNIYVTEDWVVIPRSDYFGHNLVSKSYLQLIVSFDDTWESDLPVYQAEYKPFGLV